MEKMAWESDMEHGTIWANVGHNAKSFIKGCVVVEESRRLNAKQALMHIWFTERHYAAEMEAAYNRAIQDWEPRPKRHPLVEHMKTFHSVPTSAGFGHAKRLAQEVKSKFFDGTSRSPFTVPGLPRTHDANANQYRKPSPLPSVTQDADMDNASCVSPASPRVQNSPTDSTQFSLPVVHSIATENLNVYDRLSIEDFAPPKTTFISR